MPSQQLQTNYLFSMALCQKKFVNPSPAEIWYSLSLQTV